MYYYITINTASTILTLLRYVFFFTELHVHTIIIRNFQFDENYKKKNELNNYLLLFNVAKVIKFLAYFKITIRRL